MLESIKSMLRKLLPKELLSKLTRRFPVFIKTKNHKDSIPLLSDQDGGETTSDDNNHLTSSLPDFSNTDMHNAPISERYSQSMQSTNLSEKEELKKALKIKTVVLSDSDLKLSFFEFFKRRYFTGKAVTTRGVQYIDVHIPAKFAKYTKSSQLLKQIIYEKLNDLLEQKKEKINKNYTLKIVSEYLFWLLFLGCSVGIAYFCLSFFIALTAVNGAFPLTIIVLMLSGLLAIIGGIWAIVELCMPKMVAVKNCELNTRYNALQTYVNNFYAIDEIENLEFFPSLQEYTHKKDEIGNLIWELRAATPKERESKKQELQQAHNVRTEIEELVKEYDLISGDSVEFANRLTSALNKLGILSIENLQVVNDVLSNAPIKEPMHTKHIPPTYEESLSMNDDPHTEDPHTKFTSRNKGACPFATEKNQQTLPKHNQI